MNYEPKKEIAEKLLESFNEKLYFDVIKKISELRTQYPDSIFLLNVLGVTYNKLNKYELVGETTYMEIVSRLLFVSSILFYLYEG